MAEPITLARPYAKAAFQVALDSNDLGNWSNMLRLVAAIAEYEKVATILSSPVYTSAQQVEKVLDLCGDELNEGGKNFIRVLAENRRLPLIGEIVKIFEALKANQEKSVDVEITTAYEISAEATDNLAKALKTRLQRKINLQSRVEKSLIGGAIIRAGDTVIDNSVRGKLNKLAEAMNS